jgi:hypothetical protein
MHGTMNVKFAQIYIRSKILWAPNLSEIISQNNTECWWGMKSSCSGHKNHLFELIIAKGFSSERHIKLV